MSTLDVGVCSECGTEVYRDRDTGAMHGVKDGHRLHRHGRPWAVRPREWHERDGQLADGTPLRDVAAEMPVQVRGAGSTTWHDGVVIRVDGEPGFEWIVVEESYMDFDGRERASTWRYAPNYVRRRK